MFIGKLVVSNSVFQLAIATVTQANVITILTWKGDAKVKTKTVIFLAEEFVLTVKITLLESTAKRKY